MEDTTKNPEKEQPVRRKENQESVLSWRPSEHKQNKQTKSTKRRH